MHNWHVLTKQYMMLLFAVGAAKEARELIELVARYRGKFKLAVQHTSW